MEIPRQLTPITELELVEALYHGHGRAFEIFPSTERLAVAWAQCALELKRGKSVWNYNIGNITAGSSWIGDYYVLAVPPPDPPTLKFRAHDSSVDGAEDYWRFLSRERYKSVFPLFDSGDSSGAAYKLGKLKYYLADADAYASAMGSLYREFWRRGLDSPELRRHEVIPSPEELALGGRLWRLSDELASGMCEGGPEALECLDERLKNS